MGREVRMVPPDWAHPLNDTGSRRPLLRGPFADAYEEWATISVPRWHQQRAKWAEGWVASYKDGGWEPRHAHDACMSFEAYAGVCPASPNPADYMPTFAPGTATHLMMYETCSEGTPISPAFSTPEELAHWLADTGASAFGAATATYEQWLRVCSGGYAPSMVIDALGVRSGVAL
jgi:hypothetical protein